MNEEIDTVAQRADELRRSFDESFSRAHTAKTTTHEEFIAIRVAGTGYAIRLTEISGLFAAKTVTPIPGSIPELLGVASFRATIVPVFDLRTLLGYSRGDLPRWLVLLPAASVSLAFEDFEGHLRIQRNVVPVEEPAEPMREPEGQILSVEGMSRRILHLPSILQVIRTRTTEIRRRSDK